jgi:L-arabinose isomerase
MKAKSDQVLDVWFLTGSQSLYGDDTLEQVAQQSQEIARQLEPAFEGRVRLVWKPVLTTKDGIRRVCLDATADDRCVGVVAWMHTFSPAKMWIAGLSQLDKPLLHLHTQANRSLPWATIDMDFMNLNQAAHGDREFGYVQTRMGIARKIVAGHVADQHVTDRAEAWGRAAIGHHTARNLKLARFGDNMRDVAVTEGDKVGAQIQFGLSVRAYGVNDLVAAVDAATDAEVDALVREYEDAYKVVNGLGEFYFTIRADRASGVIDMFAGPAKDQMAVFPTRVVALPDGRTAYTFTMFQGPGMPDELFESQHASLLRELENVEREFAR